MISVYLDWGIISELKQGKYPELKKLLIQKDRFLVPYSSAHIGDLLPKKNKKGNEQYVNEDLHFLSELTNNRCFNFYEQKLFIEDINPKSYYDEQIEINKEFTNFGFDTTTEFDKSDNVLSELLDRFKKVPIDKHFEQILNDPKGDFNVNDFFPGLKENLTVDGLLKGTLMYFDKLYEGEEYARLRRLTQKEMGITRDKMFTEKNPFKVIEETHKKAGINSKDYLNSGKYTAPNWYDEFCHDYLMLDMHGFQEDSITTKKKRKQTMRNINNDAFHSAFASTCNFYILKDTRAFEKTKKVYENWDMGTILIKPDDFLPYAKSFLSERSPSLDLEIPFEFFKKVPDQIKEKELYDLHSYFVPHYLFDYFNNVHGIVSKKRKFQGLILCQATPKNKKSVYLIEADSILKKFYSYFGEDINGNSSLGIQDLKKYGWKDIEWKSGKLSFHLILNEESFELHYYSIPRFS